MKIQWLYNSVQTSSYIQEQEGQISSGVKKNIFGQMTERLICSRMIGGEKYRDGKEQLSWSKAGHIICQTWSRPCYSTGMHGW